MYSTCIIILTNKNFEASWIYMYMYMLHCIQLNLQTMDTVGTGLLSIVGRLLYLLGASSLSVQWKLFASQNVHYLRFHCIV